MVLSSTNIPLEEGETSKSDVFLRRVQPIKYFMYYHSLFKKDAKPPFYITSPVFIDHDAVQRTNKQSNGVRRHISVIRSK